MPTSTKTKALERCNNSHYKQVCILTQGHKDSHFCLAWFGNEIAGVYFGSGVSGRQWVFLQDAWPPEILNLPWDVYCDVRTSATYGGILR